jgi:8-oxo-dGTP diphosphatase
MPRYTPPTCVLAVDVVIFRAAPTEAGRARLEVLLVRRLNEPYAGHWAIPGGFVEADEEPRAAAARELAEETGVRGAQLVESGVYAAPGRDPRGRVVSLAFWAYLPASAQIGAGGDVERATWFPADAPPLPLAFDHAQILADAVAGLRRRLRRGLRALEAFPDHLTLSQLRALGH